MKNNRFAGQFAEANDAFSELYSQELKQLKGLSESEISALIPDTQSKETYQALITIVEKASKENMAQAQLINNIKSLGSVAIKIASKIPTLAKLLM